MSELKLYLIRIARNSKETLGVLYADLNGIIALMGTLEDPDRDKNLDGDLSDAGEAKVAGDTCIPAGTYEVEMYNSPHFGRKLPHLLNVPGFEYILIHRGNTTIDTKGCILVAQMINFTEGKVYQSTQAEEYLIRLMQNYDKITLTISYNPLLKPIQS